MSVLSGVLRRLRRSETRRNGKRGERPAPTHEVPRAAPAPMPPPSTDDFEHMAAEARYHRDRLALYRARMHRAADGTSLSRLRELERAAAAAGARLRHALPRPHERERTVAADAGPPDARGK